jgi:hypothetical protein
MSTDKDAKASLPPEARRRGGMDTLFSAAWFDEEAAKGGATPAGADRPAAPPSVSEVEPAPKKSNTTLFVVLGLVVVLVLGGLACAGVVGAAGVWYYLSMPVVSG